MNAKVVLYFELARKEAKKGNLPYQKQAKADAEARALRYAPKAAPVDDDDDPKGKKGKKGKKGAKKKGKKK